MHLAFALIWLINGGHENRIPVKVGDYQRYSQCIEEGRKLTARERWGDNDTFKCVPINVP